MPLLTRAQTPAGVEVVWLGQAAFKITSRGGKVIVTDRWLRTNLLTPASYKQLESFGRIDMLLVTPGHFDHIADAPALAQMYDVPLRGPGDLASTVMTLGVLPSNLLPRMNEGDTVEPVPGIKVTAVRAEHSSVYVWRNPATQKDETHLGGQTKKVTLRPAYFDDEQSGSTALDGGGKVGWVATNYKFPAAPACRRFGQRGPVQEAARRHAARLRPHHHVGLLRDGGRRGCAGVVSQGSPAVLRAARRLRCKRC